MKLAVPAVSFVPANLMITARRGRPGALPLTSDAHHRLTLGCSIRRERRSTYQDPKRSWKETAPMRAVSFQDLVARLGRGGRNRSPLPRRGCCHGATADTHARAQRPMRSRRPPCLIDPGEHHHLPVTRAVIKEFVSARTAAGDTNSLITSGGPLGCAWRGWKGGGRVRRGGVRGADSRGAVCGKAAEGPRRGRCVAQGRRSAQEGPGAGRARRGNDVAQEERGAAREGWARKDEDAKRPEGQAA